MNSKLFRLLSLLPHNPGEFTERAFAMAEVRWQGRGFRPPYYQALDIDHALLSLQEWLGEDLPARLEESPLACIEKQVKREANQLPREAPFGTFHNGDLLFGRVCYATARALRANLVVETGVCYGVASACLLQALDVNQAGALHSIDLPPLGKDADAFVGWLIPQALRSRWTLHRGTSRRLLRSLAEGLGSIDLFVHDSLHTYRNMRMEFETVWPVLRPGGALISDDIEGNAAFQELASRPDVAHAVVLQQRDKNALLGVAIKRI